MTHPRAVSPVFRLGLTAPPSSPLPLSLPNLLVGLPSSCCHRVGERTSIIIIRDDGRRKDALSGHALFSRARSGVRNVIVRDERLVCSLVSFLSGVTGRVMDDRWPKLIGVLGEKEGVCVLA